MELLVMMVDRTNSTDIFKDTKLYKRGMVIEIFPDGWKWGVQERINPIFRIVRVGNLDTATIALLCMPEDGFGRVDHLTTTAQVRKTKFDLDSVGLPTDFKTFITDDTRAVSIYDTTNISGKSGLTPTALLTRVVTLAAVANPLVL